MSIDISYLEIEKQFIFNAGFRKRIIGLLKEENKKLGEISIIFTNNKKILEINKKFLNHPYYTDVITFNNSRRNVLSGDIYVSVDQVYINATKVRTEKLEEILRVTIHGILHLVGYNDKTANEKAVMRSMEDHYLCLFKSSKVIKESGPEI